MAVTAFPLATLVRAFAHGVIGEDQANNTTRAERIGRLSRLTCPSPGHLTHRLRGWAAEAVGVRSTFSEH